MKTPAISRRRFIQSSSILGAAGSVVPQKLLGADQPVPPITIFSKVYQELELDFEASARLTKAAGYDGIDCPVRPRGQVLPENVEDDLPKYVEALRRCGVSMPLITTAINSVGTPHAEKTLRTAAALGATHYRLGYWRYAADRSRQDELAEIRPKLKDLVAMNREIGICGILQNHSNGPYVGAKLTDYLDLLEGHDPMHIALAFDLGHAIKEIGEDWRNHFDRLKPWLAVAYIKDPVPGGRWAVLGGGTLGDAGYFRMLKDLDYSAAFSIHNEYGWDEGGAKTVDRLRDAMRQDAETLRRWWREA